LEGSFDVLDPPEDLEGSFEVLDPPADLEGSFEVLDPPADPLVPEDELDDVDDEEEEEEGLLSDAVADFPSDPVEDFSPDSLLCPFFLASDG